MSLRLAIVLLLVLVAPIQAQQVDTPTKQATKDPLDLPEVGVLLEGGQFITGLMVEQSDQHVVLRIGGVPRSLPAEKVKRIEIFPPVLDRYQLMRREIGPNDFSSLVQLALWLEHREQYGLALLELDRALKIEPLDRQAAELRRQIDLKKKLADKTKARLARANEPQRDRPIGEDDPADDLPRLTPADINLIRVFEIDLNDPPPMSVERETIEALIQQYAGDIRFPPTPEAQSELFDAAPSEVLALIFKLRARDYYSKVWVKDDPAALKLFKDRVHRALIVNSCATSECHAKPGAGRLRLIRNDRFSDETIYTNFLILERFRLADGTPMIDYENPPASPLLQMALDRDVSSHPHPPVPGPGGRGDLWRATMRSVDDRRFDDTVRWIQAMYRPRPDYPIELALPAEDVPAADLGPPR